MTEESTYIFDLTNPNYSYKGILFAELDFEEMDKLAKSPFPTPKNYFAGIMALIWTDEKGIWNVKFRIKFPSGNKQVSSKDYTEEFEKKIKVNETYILNELYKMPMKNKNWMKNPDGTIDGILNILEKSDMIESKRVVSTDGKK